MIEDIVAYLSADTTLTGYIGSGANCRLYPNFSVKDAVAPYIVYGIQGDQGRDKGNNVKSMIFRFSIFAATALAAETIKRRLDVLLDKDAGIVIPSAAYYIKSSWLFGGSSMYEQDTKLTHRAALYTLLFVEK